MQISITRKATIDFKELATWIVEKSDIVDIAEHIAVDNGMDEDDSYIIENQIYGNAEFWDNLHKAIIEYCQEQL